MPNSRRFALIGIEALLVEVEVNAASFDLPIALGTLFGSGQVASELLARYAIVGELALNGTTRPTKGPMSMVIAAATDKNLRGLIVPVESAAEAAAGSRFLLILCP